MMRASVLLAAAVLVGVAALGPATASHYPWLMTPKFAGVTITPDGVPHFAQVSVFPICAGPVEVHLSEGHPFVPIDRFSARVPATLTIEGLQGDPPPCIIFHDGPPAAFRVTSDDGTVDLQGVGVVPDGRGSVSLMHGTLLDRQVEMAVVGV